MTQFSSDSALLVIEAESYYFDRYKLFCFEKTGEEFQGLFDSIMQLSSPNYVSARPSGSQGDWKCDGYHNLEGAFYQCYNPPKGTDAKASKKIREDFEGCLKRWDASLKKWVFVYGFADKLPPQAIKAISDITTDNPTIVIENWGRLYLWGQILKLTDSEKKIIFGPVISLKSAQQVNTGDISYLFNHLSREEPDGEYDDEDMASIDLGDKFDKNQFSDFLKKLFIGVIPVARQVRDFIDRFPDPSYSLRIAANLQEEYNKAVEIYEKEPYPIVEHLSKYICGTDIVSERKKMAAYGIIAYYFELCEIFER